MLIVAESLEPLERTLLQARALLLGCGALALILPQVVLRCLLAVR